MASMTYMVFNLVFVKLNTQEDIDFILRSHIDSQPLCGLHWKMFIPAIKYLGTDKQVKKWLPLAESHQIIGTYAQTELGHGSDVQGLETTAIFDLEKQEFIVNSPSLTATKWWPGELVRYLQHVTMKDEKLHAIWNYLKWGVNVEINIILEFIEGFTY